MKLKIFTGVILMGFFIFMTAIVIAAAMLFYQNTSNKNSLTKKTELNSENVAGNLEVSGNEYVLDKLEVSKHNSPTDCYLIINGSVYDISSFVSVHPGGSYLVEDYCGADATAAFSSRDKNPPENHSNFAADLLRNYYIGPLGAVFNTLQNENNVPATMTPTPLVKVNIPTTVPDQSSTQTSATLILDATEVAKHNTLQNCWLIISGSIYDVTKYIYQHPGGASEISTRCGTEATAAFQTMGGRNKSHSQNANSLLGNYLIGTLGSSVIVNTGTTTQTSTTTTNTNTTTTTTTTSNTSSSNSSEVPMAIIERYPNATIISGKYEDEGSWEGKVNTSAGCRAIKVSSSGNISQDEGC